MATRSIFDIAGPIMVGPSSSHTAGACKIGQFARALFHEEPTKVIFYLHGSFAEVYKGHATDRALLGGVMKFRTSDPRIKDSFTVAKQKKLDYEFVPTDLGEDLHPNTVKIVLKNNKHKMEVTGCSIGGGMIEIRKINNFDVLLHGTAGKRLSLVIGHDNKPGVTEQLIKNIEALGGIKIAEVEESLFKKEILTVLGTEGRRITAKEVKTLEKNTPGIHYIRSLSKLQTQ